MNRLALTVVAALALTGASALRAQTPPPAGAAAASAAATPAAAASGVRYTLLEPAVERIVIEDNGTRIEELRVRGATQRIVVTPKVGTNKSYEIITGDGSRDLGDGVNTSRGAAGQRVWHVLTF